MHRITVFFLMSVLLTALGCAEYRGLQRGTGGPKDLNVGDKVKLITIHNRLFEFEVIKLTDHSIVGDNVEIDFEEIRSLEKKEIDTLKTTGAITAGVLATFLGSLLLAAMMLL